MGMRRASMLEVIVFICGAVVMILEMVGSRILAPYLGTSIVVWTSLIGVILGCLSLGYWWGGRIADRRPDHRILSHIILISGFSVAAIALSKSFILGALQEYGGSIHLASTAATFLLFAPPSVLLGMVSPYAVRLKINDLKNSGRTVGRLYAISTVGSIFGTFFAGFFLIAFVGSTNILLVLSLLLAGTSLLASSANRNVKVAAVMLFSLLFLSAKSYDAHLTRVGYHDIDTQYNRILIYPSIEEGTGKMTQVMVTGPKAQQSAMYVDDPVYLALPYTKFYNLASHFKPEMKRVLMLGGGGYSFPKYMLSHYPEVHMDVIEIDPKVTMLAKRFFHLRDDRRLSIIHQDARTFLNRTSRTYDVILGDIFNSDYAVPFHVGTVETVKKIYELLADDGVAVVNILAAIEGDKGRFLRAEYATFKAIFPQVYLYPVSYPTSGMRWQNVMLVALKSSRPALLTSTDPELNELLSHRWLKPVAADLPPLTDDYAPVDRYITTLK
jgi:spermidine synthase